MHGTVVFVRCVMKFDQITSIVPYVGKAGMRSLPRCTTCHEIRLGDQVVRLTLPCIILHARVKGMMLFGRAWCIYQLICVAYGACSCTRFGVGK